MKRIFYPFRIASGMIGDAILKAHFAIENRKSDARDIIAALPENDRREVEDTTRKYALLGVATGMFVLTAGEAFAVSGQNFGAILNNLNSQFSQGAGVAATAAYIMGAATGISGFNSLKKHSENPNDPAHTVKSGATKIGVAAGLVGLGATLSSGMASIFGSGASSISVTNGTATNALTVQ